MSICDHPDRDGRALPLLLTVAEEGSVTRAAARLDGTRSAVGHALDKLRQITGDPLFARSGRGITARAQAAVLARRARLLLDGLLITARPPQGERHLPSAPVR